MTTAEEKPIEEKKSLSFVEQMVKPISQKARMVDVYRHVFRQSQTDTCTSDTPRPYVWTLE